MPGMDVDVCIVGGGVAGLAAAERLGSAGLTVALFEARERLGGRILTAFSSSQPDLPVELGAEFVHGKHPALYEYCRKHGLALDEVEGQTYVDSGAGLKAVREQDDDRIGEILSSPDLATNDRSFARYLESLQESAATKNWAKSYVEGFNAADATRIGTKALLHQQRAEDRIEGERAWRMRLGYQAFVDSLITRVGRSVAILAGHIVKRIEWRCGRVRLEARSAEGGVFHTNAKAAVITLPAGVLHNRSGEAGVVFEPVPQSLKQVDLVAMGAAVRVNLLFRERVWEEVAPDAGFLLSGEQHFPAWWPRESESGYLLTAWSGGPKAFALPVESKGRMAELALRTLAKLLRREVGTLRTKVESVHYHDWHSDPFSRGSYSYVTAGGYDFSQHFADPVEETLWFAGEAAARDGHWGTVHGAVESGSRAGEEIAEKLLR